MSLLLENGGMLLFGADPKFFPQIVRAHQSRSARGVTISNQQVIILVVALVLMLALRFIVLYTRVGKAMRAVSFNHTAAALMGIDVDRIISFTFVLGSMLAAAAGVLVGAAEPQDRSAAWASCRASRRSSPRSSAASATSRARCSAGC